MMRRDYILTWLEKPSPACAEIGARAPIDLLETRRLRHRRGDALLAGVGRALLTRQIAQRHFSLDAALEVARE